MGDRTMLNGSVFRITRVVYIYAASITTGRVVTDHTMA